jgi:hypothetical protein
MADEPSMPKEIPAGDRDRQREIAERAGAKDPTIEINKKKEEERHRDQDRPALNQMQPRGAGYARPASHIRAVDRRHLAATVLSAAWPTVD